MAKEFFRACRFNQASRALVGQCNTIVEDYQQQGLRLTLRQLYYQLVSRNIIENKERSYKNLGQLVSKARLAGMVDWDAIEDRVRQPRKHPEYDDLEDLANAALASYRLPRWKDQACYVELWVEKDALAGVLMPLANEFHVTLMVNRGYSSQSAMFESANRFKAARNDDDSRRLVLFYLGDHDPSGEDMVRDVQDRLVMFDVPARDDDDNGLEVEKIALTMAQVRQYNPPPNPAKVTDPRAAKYMAEHGESSWEVDALPPEVLARLVREAFAGVVDGRRMDAVIAREKRDKKDLEKAVAGLVRKRS